MVVFPANGGGGNPDSGTPSSLVGTTWIAAGDGSEGMVMGVNYAALYFKDGGAVGIGWCKGRDSAIRYAQTGTGNYADGTYTADKIESSKNWCKGPYTLSGDTLTIDLGWDEYNTVFKKIN